VGSGVLQTGPFNMIWKLASVYCTGMAVYCTGMAVGETGFIVTVKGTFVLHSAVRSLLETDRTDHK